MTLRKFSFYVIACCLPFVFLGLFEGLLRLNNYGNHYPLFVPSEQFSEYLQPNPNLIKRYFPANAEAPAVSPDTYLFESEKPKDTLRIVTMGGSTMAGFPYGRFGSVAGMLKQRLKASVPSKNIEIISVAMSSINSYTLLDTSDEVIDIKPDLVLIYAGHNEFLGVMGVGSNYAGSGGHASNLLFLKLKNLHTYQLLQNFIHYFRSNTDSTDANKSLSTTAQRTVMAQIASNKQIVYGDDIYIAGNDQFRRNLDLILQKFERADIPVFISNLVANEKDQAPFESTKHAELDKHSESLLKPSHPIRAEDLSMANEAKHAEYFYNLAKRFYANKDYENAHGYFIKAMDYDLLRFRAPSSFNQIIYTLANKHGAKIVDSYSLMQATSPNKIIGNELMLEHLHPNKQGYFLLAEAFYKALLQHGIVKETYRISAEQAYNTQALTSVDEIYANYKIAQLTSDYPFTDEKKDISLPANSTPLDQIAIKRIKGASWIESQQSLLEHYQKVGQFERAANVAGLLFDAIPQQQEMARIASLLYLRAQALPLAKYYALRALQLAPQNTNYRLSFAEILFKLGNVKQAIQELDKVIELDPNNVKAKQIKQAITQ